MNIRLVVSKVDEIADFCQSLIRSLEKNKKGLNISVTNVGRTTKQNNALHSTLTAYANKLNDAGIIYRIKLGDKEVEGLWTLENLKDLFRIIANHLYKINSTAELNTVQMQECYRVFAERISANTGVYEDWHSNEPVPDLSGS